MSTEGRQLPVISLWMPWANWVAVGWKTIETRTHKRFASLKGKRIGIHASVKWDKDALDLAARYLAGWQIAQTDKFLRIGGGIICTAHVQDFRPLNDYDEDEALIECSSVQRYGLILEDVEQIPVIPCRGKQGIWYL